MKVNSADIRVTRRDLASGQMYRVKADGTRGEVLERPDTTVTDDEMAELRQARKNRPSDERVRTNYDTEETK